MLRLCVLVLIASAAQGSDPCNDGVEYWCQSMDTAKECGKVHFCDNQVWIKDDSKICTDCRAFFDDIKDLVMGPEIEKSVLDRLMSMCSQLPSIAVEYCQNFANDWVTRFFNIITNRLDLSTACETMKLCGEEPAVETNVDLKKMLKQARVVLKGQSEFACTKCKEGVDAIRKTLDNNDFREDIEEQSGSIICLLMPQHMHSDCKRHVKQLGTMLFDVLVAEMDSEVVCEAIRICPNPNVHPDTPVLHNVFNKVSDKVVGDVNSAWNIMVEKAEAWNQKSNEMVVKGEGEDANDVKVSSSAECKMCLLFVSQAEKMLKDTNTQNQLLRTVESICDILPQPLGRECQQFVEQNGHKFIDLFLQMVPPKMACDMLGLCSDVSCKDKAEKNLLAVLKSAVPPAPEVKKPTDEGMGSDPVWCLVCKQIASLVHLSIDSEQMNNGVIFMGRQLCSVFRRAKDVCDDYMTRIMTAILAGATKASDPGVICAMSGFCGPSILTPMNYSNSAAHDLTAKLLSTDLKFEPRN